MHFSAKLVLKKYTKTGGGKSLTDTDLKYSGI